MSYQGQDPNQQGQYPGSGQYGGYNPPPSQPQPTDPYSGQQYQQPNYGQQGYQQPNYGQPGSQQPNYGQSPYGTPGTSGPSSINMEPNVAAGLSYVLGWITGLVFFLIEKRNSFVRFHAMQSIIFFGGYTVLGIVINIISNVSPLLGTVLGCLNALLGIGVFVVWIICLVNAFQGKYFKLPVIGDYAERYANQGLQP